MKKSIPSHINHAVSTHNKKIKMVGLFEIVVLTEVRMVRSQVKMLDVRKKKKKKES